MPFCRPYSGVLLLRITQFSLNHSLFTELIWIDDAAMSSKVVIFDGRLFPSHIPAGRFLAVGLKESGCSGGVKQQFSIVMWPVINN